MELFENLRQIKAFVFDVDGVMTNNHALLTEEGHILRSFNMKDGYAIRQAIEKGYPVAVITKGSSLGVVQRLRALGVLDVFAGVTDKLDAFEEFCFANQIDEGDVLYMGDDIPDYEVMRRVGLPTCPYDAVPEIHAISRYVSPYHGGQGCVRDVIEKVLKLHDHWMPFPEVDLL